MPEELKVEFLFEMAADVNFEGFSPSGAMPQGSHVTIYITGGRVEGSEIRGTVLPSRGDQTILRSDGSVHLDVRVTVHTDDEQLVHVHFPGRHVVLPAVLQRMSRGEQVDPSEYYLRTTPVFETDAEKYAWLSRLVAVGIGRFTPTGIAYRVYKVL